MSATRVLITGASGFLGAALVQEAVADGFLVRGLSRRRAASVPDWRQADILDVAAVQSAMEGVGAVIHSAGLAHQFASKTARSEFQRINVDGARVVAAAAARARVPRFVLVSSVAVYGSDDVPESEDALCRPQGPYGESKLAGERVVRDALGASSTSLTTLRMSTLYGVGDPGNVARLIRLIQQRHFVWIGSGSNRKSLLHRHDAARACVAALRFSDGGGVYNVSDQPRSVCEVVQQIFQALGYHAPRFHLPAGPLRTAARLLGPLLPTESLQHAATSIEAWLRDDVYDGGRFELMSGFHCVVPWPAGLRAEVEWILDRDSDVQPES